MTAIRKTPLSNYDIQDIHYVFLAGFKDTLFNQERLGLKIDYDVCLLEGVAAAEQAGWSFHGPSRISIDADWLQRLLVLASSTHGVLGDRLQHMQGLSKAMGSYWEGVTVMGKVYFLPSEIVALLRRNCEGV